MEASIPAGNAEMALAYRCMGIAVSEEALKDKCPLVGVGLVYTPLYILKVAFSAAYMHLNEWNSAAASEVASEDRLVGTRLLLIQVAGRANSFPLQMTTPSCWMWSLPRQCAAWRGLCHLYL